MKKVFGLALAFLLMMGISAIGTWAFFLDSESSTGNTFAAGTLDLKTNDVDGVSQTLLATNMAPGETIGPETIILKNSGSLDSASVDIEFSYSESDNPKNPVDKSADETAALIEVTTLIYSGSSILSAITDNNYNGYRDIYDLRTSSLNDLSGIDASDSKDFTIAIKARNIVGGDFQADGIIITITFTLHQ
jgi:predicted ribosomally synthesized peptide with SipW-like signal peptide